MEQALKDYSLLYFICMISIYMDYFEGYALEKTITNGTKRVREVASTYDGKELRVLQNIDGDVTYETLSNGDIMEKLSTIKQKQGSLLDRLSRIKSSTRNSSKSVRSKKSRRNNKNGRSKVNSKKSRRSKHKGNSNKSKSKKSQKYRTSPKTKTRRNTPRVVPDIMKTIY